MEEGEQLIDPKF